MSSNVPVVRQIAWAYFIPQFLLVFCLIFVYTFAGVPEAPWYAIVTYLILSIVLRNLIARKHREGMRLVRQRRFDEAIPLFEESVNFFTRNSWIDKYRYLTLLSSSRMSYREMGLCNIAFCYGQTNNGAQAKNYYERVLQEYPKNGLAIAGLNMLNAFGKPDR